MADKPPVPCDVDAERSVLGAIMLDPDAAGIAVGIITHQDFWRPAHSTIWSGLLRLIEDDKPVDLVSLADDLRKRDELKRVGDVGYLHDVYSGSFTSSNIEHYANIVAGHARQRRLIEAGTKLVQVGWMEDEDERSVKVAEIRDSLAGDVLSPLTTPTTWAPVDLLDVLAGDIIAPAPEVLQRDDGKALFYAGKIHVLAGESESGKTWIALHAAAQVMAMSGDVLYLDFEDSVQGIVGRLLALGVPQDVIARRLMYVQPDEALEARGLAVLTPLLLARDVRLAIVDGVTEAMQMHGLDPDKGLDAAAFYARIPRYLARLGPATVLIDHVNKDPETRSRYATGSQHKLAGLDGAQFLVSVSRPFGVGRQGKALMRVAKDRPGRVREHQADGGLVGILWLNSDHDGRCSARLASPDHDDPVGFRPTGLMEKISRYVEAHPGLSQKSILTAVRGSDGDMRLAIESLVAEGYIQIKKQGQTHLHYHVRPFRDEPDDDGGYYDDGAAPPEPPAPPGPAGPPEPGDQWEGLY